MDRYQDILLAIWREVGRHVEIREAAQNVALILEKRLPLEAIYVRRWNPRDELLETVAVGAPRRPQIMVAPTSEFTARESSWLSQAANARRPRSSRRCSCGKMSFGSSGRVPWYRNGPTGVPGSARLAITR